MEESSVKKAERERQNGDGLPTMPSAFARFFFLLQESTSLVTEILKQQKNFKTLSGNRHKPQIPSDYHCYCDYDYYYCYCYCCCVRP